MTSPVLSYRNLHLMCKESHCLFHSQSAALQQDFAGQFLFLRFGCKKPSARVARFSQVPGGFRQEQLILEFSEEFAYTPLTANSFVAAPVL